MEFTRSSKVFQIVEIQEFAFGRRDDQQVRAMAREDPPGAAVPAAGFRGPGRREFEHFGEQAAAEHYRQAPGPRSFHRGSRRNDPGRWVPGLCGGGDQPPDQSGGEEGLVQRGDHRPEDLALGGQGADPDLERGEHAPLVGGVVDGAHWNPQEFGGDLAVGVAEDHDQRGEAGLQQGFRGGADQGPAGAVGMGEEGLGAVHPLRLAGGEEDAGGIGVGLGAGFGNGDGPSRGRRVYCGNFLAALRRSRSRAVG